MNLILLEPSELSPAGALRLTGRRAAHVLEVLRPSVGDRLQVGVAGGLLGTGEVLALAPDSVTLQVRLERAPPPRAPVDLLLALPRPKILRKVLHAAAAMGVGRLVLLGSWRVEKSYFGSPLLEAGALDAELRLGLEQGRDTVAPEVLLRRRFKPFVEDELDAAFPGAQRLLAHPAAAGPLEALAPRAPRAVVAVGPEGGWTPYEADALARHGFEGFSLGPRVLRVDAAVPYVAGQVELWIRTGSR
ncbi:16S rRNA (uracil(1498)-N(3))-methyltransferase [Anaeromyxobacter diazotrophicus]|uniref:Ribosomal RNA small subunit methyltransferase E n=1 Tax=Anaeromyxobacter diazotrophicus TaxID=2590199 RepID=A0A7I9VG98_9BACT|nr:16S rRNA (uracil(1498)-N(3))-methyltransferase [Anaeromyxobacter diazotrophicus]GEJ55279.1 ribosomal RNA small subunit methyltransferase E [Anaeromyxobacter diazotrophicus]